ncbi:surface-associated interspersed protein (SURFIN), partial [Plasmodium gallinaceum]
MRKKSILKKARFLSQAEETSCILDEQNGKTKENEDNSPSETSKLKTEIESFMDDTGNELRFYLEDNNITNDTEKCKKASSYINWRGMDYVNLLLSEKEKYNISCLVEKWKEKQKSFQTSIDEKMKSTCSTATFDYCAILNKNDKCTRPYEYNDLPVPTSLTYAQLNDDSYSTNKTQIIEDRRLSFLNITNDMSHYHFRVYENHRSERNCGKWSMYIYKRGKQFVNMAENELYDDQLYINDSIRIWNVHSNTLQNTELEDTGIQCNMTTLIHQIKERQNTTDPYNLDWLSSSSTQNKSNETSNNTNTSPDNLQPTAVTPVVLHNDTATDSLGNNTTSVNDVNGNSPFENTLTNDTSVPPVAADQIAPETATPISPEESTQFNSLSPKDTIHSNNNTISDTTSSSHSPDIVTSPATSLPSETVISVNKIISTNGNSSVTNDTATDSLGNNTTSVNNVYGNSPFENTLRNDTSETSVTTDKINPETAFTISPENSTQSNSLTPKVTIHSNTNTNTISDTTSSSHSPEVVTSPATETLPSNSTTSSGTPSVTPLPRDISATATNEYSITTMKSFTNNITPSTTITTPPTTASLSSPEDMSPTNIAIPSNNHTVSLTSSVTPTVTPLHGEISATSTNEYSIATMKTFTYNITPSTTPTKSPETSLPSETVTFVNKNISTNGNTYVTNDTASPSIDPISPPDIAPSLTTMTTTPTDDSTPPLPLSTPEITTLPSTNNSTSRTNDMPIHPTNDVTHKTTTSPLTDSSSPFLTNTIENSTITIEPFTNRVASPETDITSLAINTTTLMPDTIAPTALSNSLDKTPILTTPTAFFHTTNNNLSSNQTDSIQLQNQQIIHAPLKQVQQHVNGINCTGNTSPCPSAIAPDTLTPTTSSDPTEVTPTLTPKGNLLIPMVSVGIFILGIIFLLVLICKCTPIGSWIRNRKSKKKKARKKIKKITREPLLMDTNNIKNEPINNENYSFLYHEKEIPLCDMIVENEKDLKYKHVKKSKAHKGMYMENGKDLKHEKMKKSKAHKGTYMENEIDLMYEQIQKSNAHEETYMENDKDLKFEQIKKSKTHDGTYIENEIDLRYEEMKKSKVHEGMYMENENKCIPEVVEISKKHENESILGEKLYQDDPRNEIEEIEFNVNKSRNEIKDELNKNILEKDPVHIVWHIRNGTLNEEKANEINLQKEKSTCENEMKNLEKRSLNDEVCTWNTWINIHMIALLEYKKEEWKLNKTEFFKICSEEIEKDRENSNLKEMGNNFVMKIKEENNTDTIDKNSSILEKYKNEEWFINLKKEWEEEQEKHLQYLEGHEIKKMSELGLNNFILSKKKKIWKEWIEWQIKHSYEYKNQKWFVQLLEEYEKEEIEEILKEEKIEKERNNGIDKNEMKKNLERRILLDIYMMVLEECIKEELQKEEEFYKTNIKEIRKFKNLDEETNKLEKIGKERSWNVISEKEKDEIEKWKKEKWFIELMLEWKNNEEKYMMEINEEILAKRDQGRVMDIILERQSNILKKHCENICRKWKENDNNEEWFTKLVKVHENEEKEYKSRIDNNSIEKKKENVKTIESCEPLTEYNKKGEEKMRKYERNSLEESYEKSNSKINKKKLKCKTLIEIYMVILEEYRKEEWLLNRGKFLEICLEEFIEEDKEKYPKLIEKDL